MPFLELNCLMVLLIDSYFSYCVPFYSKMMPLSWDVIIPGVNIDSPEGSDKIILVNLEKDLLKVYNN